MKVKEITITSIQPHEGTATTTDWVIVPVEDGQKGRLIIRRIKVHASATGKIVYTFKGRYVGAPQDMKADLKLLKFWELDDKTKKKEAFKASGQSAAAQEESKKPQKTNNT